MWGDLRGTNGTQIPSVSMSLTFGTQNPHEILKVPYVSLPPVPSTTRTHMERLHARPDVAVTDTLRGGWSDETVTKKGRVTGTTLLSVCTNGDAAFAHDRRF
jgi:hypothetical protein